MASATLDIPRLSSFADVAEDSVNELLSEPNVELLTAILSKISKRARDYEECQSSNLKLKVELENAVRAGDAKYRAVKSSLDKSSEETGQLRKQLQTSGTFDRLWFSVCADLHLQNLPGRRYSSNSNQRNPMFQHPVQNWIHYKSEYPALKLLKEIRLHC